MCGRFLSDVDLAEMTQAIILGDEIFKSPNTDVKPGDAYTVIVGRNEQHRLKTLRWGMTGKDGRLLINARSETLRQRPTFAKLMGRRCLVPATLFYEWERLARMKVMHRFGRKNSGVLYLAGLYDEEAFVIITMASEGDVAKIHDRMPVALSGPDIDRWLDGSAESAYETLLAQHPDYQQMDQTEQLRFW